MKRSKLLHWNSSPNTNDGSRVGYSDRLTSLIIFISINFVKALNSNAPSTLDSSLNLLQQKQQQRISQGRGNIAIGNQYSLPSDVQKQYNLAYFGNESEPPALKSTVRPLPGTPEFVQQALQEAAHQPESESEHAEMSVRQIKNKYSHKTSSDKKTVTLKTGVWNQIMDDIHKLRNDYEQSMKDNHVMQQDSQCLNKTIRDLEGELADIKKEFEALKKNKPKGRKNKSASREDEARDDVKLGIRGFMKDVLFRTVKFAVPGPSLDAASAQTWNGLKDKLKLDVGPNAITLDDFTAIYGASILKELSARRQYCQSRCKKAADGA